MFIVFLYVIVIFLDLAVPEIIMTAQGGFTSTYQDFSAPRSPLPPAGRACPFAGTAPPRPALRGARALSASPFCAPARAQSSRGAASSG